MRLVVLSVALVLAIAEEQLAEEPIICSSWMTTFASAPELGENTYWECVTTGQAAVLKTCPEEMIYITRRERCGFAPTRYLKREEDAKEPKDLELLTLEGVVGDQALGILYNARTQQFLPSTFLWNREEIERVKHVEPQVYSNLDVYQENDFNDRAFNLDVKASLSLGIMSGLIEVSGSAAYLQDRKDNSNTARVVMSYKSTTRAETIPLTTEITGRYVNNCQDANTDNGPTHVVTSVLYGLRAFLRFDKEASSMESVEEIGGKLSVKINSIPGFTMQGSAWVDIDGKEVKSDDTLKVMYHGDTSVTTPTSYLSAIQAFNEVQEAGLTGNTPVRYQLTPLSYLCTEDTAQVHEIGESATNEAIKSLIEMENLILEVKTLMDTDIAARVPDIKTELDNYKTALENFERNYKTSLKTKLKELRAGTGRPSDLIALIQGYQQSAFFYEKAHSFLEQRKRVINTIRLISDAVRDNKAPGDEVIFTMADSSSADTACMIDASYTYEFVINLTSEKGVTAKFLETKTVENDDSQWYNDPDTVGEVGGRLDEYIDFALSTWKARDELYPEEDDKHCFLIKLETNKASDETLNDKTVDILYTYFEYDGTAQRGSDFQPPLAPPKPVCKPLFKGFAIETKGTDNEAVVTHWIRATNAEQQRQAKKGSPTSDNISIGGLRPNTAYNITTKFKVLDDAMRDRKLVDLGFGPVSEMTECVTAPTTPVRDLAVTDITSSSLTVNWNPPEQKTEGVEIKYALKVREAGASDAESIRVEKSYSATSHVVSGLSPAKLYEIIIITKTDVSRSEEVTMMQSTAPGAIPFPEVKTITNTTVTMVEKLSLVELPEGAVTNQLLVKYEKSDIGPDGEINPSADAITEQIDLAGSTADKEFTINSLESGKSYNIHVQLTVTFNGEVLGSDFTDDLVVTTPFGGTETDKIVAKFDQIKEDTNARISDIDGELDTQEDKLARLERELEQFKAEAVADLDAFKDVFAQNTTLQESVLTGVAKKYCIETGLEYSGDLISQSPTGSVFQCLAKCRDESGCNGVSWDRRSKYCKLIRQRRGNMRDNTDSMISVNRVCYDTLTGASSKWKQCLKINQESRGSELSGGVTTGLGSEWDCMGWCLSLANCQSISYEVSRGKCTLFSREYGNGLVSHSGFISISLPCMQQ